MNLPKVGVGAELVGQLRLRPLWPIELAAAYWFDNHAELSDLELDLGLDPNYLVLYPAGGARLRVTGAQLRAAVCPLERAMGADALQACAGVQAGLVRVESEGFIGDRTQTKPTFALEVFARYHFSLGARFGVSYSAGLFVALLRERFGYRARSGQFAEAFQTSTVGGRLDLALTYEL